MFNKREMLTSVLTSLKVIVKEFKLKILC